MIEPPIIEYELYQSLLNDLEDRTIIIISHRLTFSYKMDLILCFNEGKLVEVGKHNDLIKNGGLYSEMYHLSAEKYSIDP